MSAQFSLVRGTRCVTCETESALDDRLYTCPDCGPIAGTLDVLYDTDALRSAFTPRVLRERSDPSLWRYHEFLPVRDPAAVVPLPAGMTPLFEIGPDAWQSEPGHPRIRTLWIKDDTRNPSASTKDRASSVGVAHARELRAGAVAAASTGNAASSLAAFAARAGLPCNIFAPAAAPPAKLIQIRACGARLFAVQGTYDEAFDLCAVACERKGWYNRSTAINPILGEGKKTAALEIWEQLGYRAPDVVIVPVGDGCILGGMYKGFRDLADLGLIGRLPRLIGVQAEGSSALARAWREGRERCEPERAETVADSLAVSMPRDQVKALRAVRETQGAFVTVSDVEILRALSGLAERAGLFVEPAAAAGWAGLDHAWTERRINGNDEVVLLLTGHGLKDVASADRAAAHNAPVTIRPQFADLERALGSA